MLPDFSNCFLVFARAGALLAVFPLFSSQNFPVHLRIGLAAISAVLIGPLLPPVALTPLSLWALIRLVFIETAAGLLLGYVCRMIFFAIETAGAIVATEMGLMMSSNFNVLVNTMTQIPGTILHWLGMVLLLSLDMHHWMLAAFQRSYALLPFGGGGASEALALDLVGRTAGTFRLALQMTAPVLAVSFTVMLVFSVLGRAVPQMNVFSESFPVRTMAGLTVFGLTCNLMAQHIGNYLRRMPEDMLRVAQLLGGG